MVTAEFECTKERVSLRMTGHAGAGARGHDPICAAVSALALALSQTAEHMHAGGLLSRAPEITLEEGHAEITASPEAAFRSEILTAFWTVQNGLALLAEAYPEHIRLDRPMQISI